MTLDAMEARIPLIGETIAVYVYGGDGQRFARLFRETWRAVPLTARRRILDQWQRYGRPSGPEFVEFMNGWSGRGPNVAGCVGFSGKWVRFHWPYVDRMSDADVRYVIAHELVHVLQWAEGTWDMGWGSKASVERDATARALAWLGLNRRPRRTPALRELQLAELLAELMANNEKGEL